ncbi:alpha/beta hydrolase [Nocardia stercoris]|uniref:Esterase family protein n=1 Tax=Nocardia stercoris TaxID=2483361 RepID=A0A3M2LHG9_9NOCA|nr:alpha/beta hydrolase family protein [Nocardia stercoris]RMI34208.1 esterase family protein [Nocardia stercoris]
MRFGTRVASLARLALAAFAVAVLPFTATAGVAAARPVAGPVHRMTPGAYEELWVPSEMGPVKVQVQWARNGGGGAVYLLDGLRARDDRNAWSFETDAQGMFAEDNVTLVMPVGGQSSWYADWGAAGAVGQRSPYKWETFLTRDLPTFLAGYGVSPTANAVVGLSMSGPAALRLAAFHRDQFTYAASLSGPLSMNGPGMREAIRAMMLDAGRFDCDALAAPWSPIWLRMDPIIFAPQLRGLPMFISSATGVPGAYDRPADLTGVVNTVDGAAIEALALIGTRAFQGRLTDLNIPAIYDFPSTGTHGWRYWQDELAKARPSILATVGS